jgi:hypothetical protein
MPLAREEARLARLELAAQGQGPSMALERARWAEPEAVWQLEAVLHQEAPLRLVAVRAAGPLVEPPEGEASAALVVAERPEAEPLVEGPEAEASAALVVERPEGEASAVAVEADLAEAAAASVEATEADLAVASAAEAGAEAVVDNP